MRHRGLLEEASRPRRRGAETEAPPRLDRQSEQSRLPGRLRVVLHSSFCDLNALQSRIEIDVDVIPHHHFLYYTVGT